MSKAFHIATREEREAYAKKLPPLGNSLFTAFLPVITFLALPRAFKHQPAFQHWGWLGLLVVTFVAGLNFYRLRDLYIEMKPSAERNTEVMTTLKAAIRFHDSGNLGVLVILAVIYALISN